MNNNNPNRIVLDARKMKFRGFPIVHVEVDLTKELKKQFKTAYLNGKSRLPIDDDLHLVGFNCLSAIL